MPHYKEFHYTNEKGLKVVKVGSTYAGVPVWGYAVCAPEDEYDETYGYRLAKARCDAKIAKKRYKRAVSQVDEINRIAMNLRTYFDEKLDYLRDSEDAYLNAVSYADEVEQEKCVRK